MPRQMHSSLYLCDPNLWTGMKGCYVSTRPDSCLIRNAMGSGPGHSGWKWLPFTMNPNTSGTQKWGNKCAYTYRDTGSPLDRSTPKGVGDMAQAVECHFAGTKSWVQAPVQPKEKEKNIWGWGHSSVGECLPACARPWVQFPCIAKSKKMVRKINDINATSAIS
jgi:hypothetical protein